MINVSNERSLKELISCTCERRPSNNFDADQSLGNFYAVNSKYNFVVIAKTYVVQIFTFNSGISKYFACGHNILQ